MKKLASAVVAVLMTVTLLLSLPAHAGSPWMDGSLNVKVADSQNCSKETIVVTTTDASAHYQRFDQACVIHGRYVDVALGYNSYVRFRTENEFRVLSVYENAHFAEGADTLIAEDKNPQYTSGELVVVNNFSQALRPVQRNAKGVVTMYDIDPAKMQRPLSGHSITSLALSANGRYATAYVDYEGIAKIDLQTLKSKYILRLHSAWYYTSDVPYVTAISDSGQYVYVGNSEQLVDGAGCEADLPSNNDWYGYSSQCRTRDLGSVMSGQLGSFPQSLGGSFTDDNMLELEVRSRSGVNNYYQKHVSLSTSAYDSTRLDYLALGDSYSSGEGDVQLYPNGTSHYVSGTEKRGQCHLSDRSYPYLLRDYYHIASSSMKSIACSGAKVRDDYDQSVDSYLGQGGRLGSMNTDDRVRTQQNALNYFMPGDIPQLEFVKKYKPKILTLTGGGNDVGFAEVLKYCASFHLGGTIRGDDTCSFAIPGSDAEKTLYDAIDTQYTYNLQTVKKIHDYSPDTKVIIVGYPKFINENEFVTCFITDGLLNHAERVMINNAVTRMNSMLLKVANDSDATYVDVGNSLVGGRLCEGSQYVTNLWDIGIKKIIDNDTQQAFHPNSQGNRKLADTIIGSFAFSSDVTNPASTYEPQSNRSISLKSNMIGYGTIIKSHGSAKINSDAHMYGGISSIAITAHSDPISLGTYYATQDGALDATIPTDKLSPGYHLIEASGTSPSGEAITLYQFILVKESETDNIFDLKIICQLSQTNAGSGAEDRECMAQNGSTNNLGDNSKEKSTNSSAIGSNQAGQVATDSSINSHDKPPQKDSSNTMAMIVHHPDNWLTLKNLSIFAIIILIISGGIYGIKKIKKHERI